MNKEFDINTPRIFELEDVDHDEDVEFEANNYISTQMLEQEDLSEDKKILLKKNKELLVKMMVITDSEDDSLIYDTDESKICKITTYNTPQKKIVYK